MIKYLWGLLIGIGMMLVTCALYNLTVFFVRRIVKYFKIRYPNKFSAKEPKDKSLVRPYYAVPIIGALCLLLCAMFVYLFLADNDPEPLIALIPFFGMSIYLLLHGLLWKIKILEDGIEYRNLIGTTKKYLYSEITGLRNANKSDI